MLQEQGTDLEKGALAKIVESLPRIDWLDEERFEFLKNRIGSAADPIGSDEILREALQFLFVDDRLSAVFLITQSTGMNIRESIDLMRKIHAIVMSVALEGYRRMEKEGKVAVDFIRAFEAHVSKMKGDLEMDDSTGATPET
jgi:hypothetical protein